MPDTTALPEWAQHCETMLLSALNARDAEMLSAKWDAESDRQWSAFDRALIAYARVDYERRRDAQ